MYQLPLKINEEGMPVWQGSEIKLPPKEKAVLGLLIKHYPKPVAKDEIIRAVWPDDASVSDDSLTRCISQIRKVLPVLKIESVYGYGYKLISATAPKTSYLSEVMNGPLGAIEKYLYAVTLAQQFTESSLNHAISVFRNIIYEHPQYMPARLGIAHALASSIALGPDKTVAALCAEAWFHLDIASKASPNINGLDRTQGLLCDVTWQFDLAHSHFIEALRRDPCDTQLNLLYAWHLVTIGRGQEAIAFLLDAVQKQPAVPALHALLARGMACVERYQDAMKVINKAEEKFGLKDSIITGAKVMILANASPCPELIPLARTLSATPLPLFSQICLPFVLAKCGEIDEARSEITKITSSKQCAVSESILLISTLIALGEQDQAAEIAIRAYKLRYSWLPFLLQFPAYSSLQEHPKVKEICASMYASIKNIKA